MQKYCMQRTSVLKPCEPLVRRWTDTLQEKLVLTLMFLWKTLSLAACCIALLCLYIFYVYNKDKCTSGKVRVPREMKGAAAMPG